MERQQRPFNFQLMLSPMHRLGDAQSQCMKGIHHLDGITFRGGPASERHRGSINELGRPTSYTNSLR
jgi:hypothetical protein